MNKSFLKSRNCLSVSFICVKHANIYNVDQSYVYVFYMYNTWVNCAIFLKIKK